MLTWEISKQTSIQAKGRRIQEAPGSWWICPLATKGHQVFGVTAKFLDQVDGQVPGMQLRRNKG